MRYDQITSEGLGAKVRKWFRKDQAPEPTKPDTPEWLKYYGLLDDESFMNKDWIVYHGSKHNFEMFDSDKIGTGEGNQTFGYGIYFAENEAIARSYGGTFYVARLHATPGDMLIWDRRLREQPPKVQQAFHSLLTEPHPQESGERIYGRLALTFGHPIGLNPITNTENYSSHPPKASAALYKTGVKGICYHDAGSRDRSSQQITNNVVMFNSRDIELVAKSG
jgi:hypothetical protein